MPTGSGDELAKNICREYAVLLEQRRDWEPEWQAIADVMLPWMNDITTRRTPGTTRTQAVLDGTAMESLQLLVGHINGGVTNFLTRWFGLRMHNPMAGVDQETRVWLDLCAQTMTDWMTASTIPQAVHEMYLSYAAFGTGCLYLDEAPMVDQTGFRGFMPKNLAMGSYAVAEDATGAVDTLYRELELSPRQAAQQFGEDNLHDSARQLLTQEAQHRPQPYLHCVYPRKDRTGTGYGTGQKQMAYASVYLDQAHAYIVQEGGYRWFPFCVPRWAKVRAFTPWGYGPGHVALPDTLTLNAIDADMLRAMPLWIQPPFWTDDQSAVGKVSLLPGAVNPLTKGSTIQPMMPGGQPDMAKLGVDDRRRRIQRIFFVDQLLTLPPAESTSMTAYEVAQRLGLMQRLLGPAFTRLLSEFLNPFLDMVFGLLLMADELPQPPDAVIEAALAGQGKIEVDYNGPLARSQKGDEADALDGTLVYAQQVASATESMEVYDNFDLDLMARRKAEILGAPAAVLRDPRQVLQARQQRAQAQQQQTQLDQAEQVAGAAQKATPAVQALQQYAQA